MKHLWTLLVILGLMIPSSALGIKIAALPVLTTVASGDLLIVEDISEPVVADKTKQMTWGLLMAAPGPLGETTDDTGRFTYLGINVAAGSTYPLHITMTAAQKTAFYVDGTTNPYTGAATCVVYDVKRDINRGTNDLVDYAGQSNYLNIKHTNAQTGDINYVYANINRIDNDANIINATAHNDEYHEYGTYSWIDSKGVLYDTQSTGNIDVVLTGVQAFMETNSTNLGSEDGDFKFSNTGLDGTLTNTLDVRGFKARMFHDPELLSGKLDITTTGFDATIISQPVETGGTLTQVTSGVKINIDADTAGTSTAYGIYIEALGGADTNYAIYSASTADSYLAGSLVLGRSLLPSIVWRSSTMLGATPGDSMQFFSQCTDNTDGAWDCDGILRQKVAGADTTFLFTDADGNIEIGHAAQLAVITSGVLSLPETTTPGAISDSGAVYTKSDNQLYFQDGDGGEHVIGTPDTNYAGMYLNDNNTDTVIGTADHPVMLHSFTTGSLQGFTFDAGRIVDADIANEIDAGAGVLQIETSGAHNLTTGDVVSQTGMADAAHNGITIITVVNGTNYTCDDIVYNANAGVSAGHIVEGSHLIAGTGSAGQYLVSFHISTHVDAADTVKLQLYINSTACIKCIGQRRFANNDQGNITGGSIVTIAEGNKIYLTVTNTTGTNDLTNQYGNFVMHRL